MSNVTDKQFVEAWIEAVKGKTGVKALANKLQMSYQDVTVHASFLRRAGVFLPTMPHPNQKSDRNAVDAAPLNELIKKELGEQAMGWRYRRSL